MKTTVLKASLKTASEISKDLLSRTDKHGRPIFKRAELEGDGFEITAMTKEGRVVVFRYTAPDGRQRFDYDERLLTFE